MLISGGTGAGKTTLLNILSLVHPGRRADRHHRGLGRAAAPASRTWSGWRPGRPTSKGRARCRSACCWSTPCACGPTASSWARCRGAEAVDMLQAMNTGHDGSLTTLHANTPRDALSRLETMVSMAGLDLPERAMRQQIASAINLVVQVSRLARRHPQGDADLRDRRHGRRHDHHAGHLRLRARRASARASGCWASSRPPASGPRARPAQGLRHRSVVHAVLQPRDRRTRPRRVARW